MNGPLRIAVVGGGPAGLYLAALAKRDDPRREVRVWERNGEADTDGFGVILSGGALDALGRADPALTEELRALAVGFDRVTLHHAGSTASLPAPPFTALPRAAVLELLGRRCVEAGVDVRYRAEAASPEALLHEYHLVVAADGAGSRIREALAPDLGAQADQVGVNFIWLGTGTVLDGLTFAVRDVLGGPLVVHAYPYGGEGSTFLVESPVAMPSVDELERIFADVLDGGSLRSNHSAWRRFTQVRSQRWSHGAVVLLGDAAHTTHYSIGSGTKLALEDALVLASALREDDDPVRAAGTYAESRKPVVARAQEVAEVSRRWFASVGDRLGTPAPRLLNDLITRGGGLTIRDLEVADGSPASSSSAPSVPLVTGTVRS